MSICILSCIIVTIKMNGVRNTFVVTTQLNYVWSKNSTSLIYSFSLLIVCLS